MRTVVWGLKATGLIAALWIGYNMYIFAAIAAGKKIAYIPYLHFPIKAFVVALS